jgi:hypothetical protein
MTRSVPGFLVILLVSLTNPTAILSHASAEGVKVILAQGDSRETTRPPVPQEQDRLKSLIGEWAGTWQARNYPSINGHYFMIFSKIDGARILGTNETMGDCRGCTGTYTFTATMDGETIVVAQDNGNLTGRYTVEGDVLSGTAWTRNNYMEVRLRRKR